MNLGRYGQWQTRRQAHPAGSLHPCLGRLSQHYLVASGQRNPQSPVLLPAFPLHLLRPLGLWARLGLWGRWGLLDPWGLSGR